MEALGAIIRRQTRLERLDLAGNAIGDGVWALALAAPAPDEAGEGAAELSLGDEAIAVVVPLAEEVDHAHLRRGPGG